MRQIGGENEDPLKRIQEEINEVTKRELELRNQLRYDSVVHKQQSLQLNNSDDSGISTTSSSPINGTSANSSPNHSSNLVEPVEVTNSTPSNLPVPTPTKSNTNYVRSTSAAAFVFAPRNPKPPKPVEFYKPAPVKAANRSKSIDPNMLTRTVSTPQLFHSISMNPRSNGSSQRGIMERFIATRGKLSTTPTATVKHAGPIVESGPKSAIFLSPTVQKSPPLRDESGRLIRKGFVPVEEKIQKELREMKTREVELMVQRQKSGIYDSNHNLLDYDSNDTKEQPDSLNSSDFESENYNLRSSKSISELSECSPRNTPTSGERLNAYKSHVSTNGGFEHPKLRPAVSLAQLCDLDPHEEVASSYRLIAQWECMIQKKREIM